MTPKQFFLKIFIFAVVVTTCIYLYSMYSMQFKESLGNPNEIIYIEDFALSVSIADDAQERRQGLSNTASLPELEGKLFVFDDEGYHSIWMKDMNYPLDIIWIDNEYTIVHIEKNVAPDTYPASFAPNTPARFVLEVNAFFTESFNVDIGDRLEIPPSSLPDDLLKKLKTL